MRNLRLLIFILLVVAVGLPLNSQQVPMYSQYIMNGFLINPSYAGSDGYSTINLTAREQWVGMPQAPSTYALSFQTRLLQTSYITKSTSVRKKAMRPTKGGRIGLGGYFFNDNNGIIRRTGFQAAYAYHIPIGTSHQLSFGLAATAYQFALDLQGALLFDVDDDYFNNYDRVVYIPDFNFGASFMSRNYYVGFAMSQMFRGVLMMGNDGGNNQSELGHYFLTGGLKIPLPARDWMVEPSALIKSSDMLFKSFQMDLTTRVYYKEDYWAGISWRTGDALIIMTGIRYDRFYFAYAFDFTLTDIRQQSFGSHEITAAVKFGDSARRYRWINRY
ncbi:MAG: type IX secretion system membrane protein PorP/SprF [Bacteroidales bacterium]|jgi:type IX secretion system PorP/SprF family membrane protein|nr:type IX secretion system membrane protein PorP/SprF [Bacteroidales bacterium]